jgi:hypothetical protein
MGGESDDCARFGGDFFIANKESDGFKQKKRVV